MHLYVLRIPALTALSWTIWRILDSAIST